MSANRPTVTWASSSAVRVTSSVLPTVTPASYSSRSRRCATSARPVSASSSVESRSVATEPGGPPSRSVGRTFTASSRSPAITTSSVTARPAASSSSGAGSRPSSASGRPSASGGRSSSRRASSLQSSSRPSPPRISTPSRTACSTAAWCSYMRVISVGPRPWVCRFSRRLISAEPPVASPSAAAAAPSTTGSWRSLALLTLAIVMPADTIPTICPSGARTGTIACTSGPMVPTTSSVTTCPDSAGW